jgi:hypothetical protein
VLVEAAGQILGDRVVGRGERRACLGAQPLGIARLVRKPGDRIEQVVDLDFVDAGADAGPRPLLPATAAHSGGLPAQRARLDVGALQSRILLQLALDALLKGERRQGEQFGEGDQGRGRLHRQRRDYGEIQILPHRHPPER